MTCASSPQQDIPVMMLDSVMIMSRFITLVTPMVEKSIMDKMTFNYQLSTVAPEVDARSMPAQFQWQLQ